MADRRQPWPMKWIVVAIVLFAVPYTFITLRYRKPGRAFEPYEDLKNRANVSRLLAAGYQRIALTARRPADGPRVGGGADVSPAPGGLPADLASTLVEPPRLPTEVLDVTAAPSTATMLPYAIQFTCSVSDEKHQLGGAELYVRGDQLVFVPTFEPMAGTLSTRSRHTAVLLTIPGGTLKPGTYTATVLGERSSRTWSLGVK